MGTLRISHTSSKLHRDIPSGSFKKTDLRKIGAITDTGLVTQQSIQVQPRSRFKGVCYLLCLKCVLMKATCEREIFKLFQVTKCKACYSFKLEKNTKSKMLKLNLFYLVEKNSAFSCRLQTANQDRLSQVSVQSLRTVCFSKLLGFIQYNISVLCKLAQWRVADPVAFYTRRATIISGISGYVKLVTLYCHAIFWATEGFGEGCVKIMQIVSC